MTRLGIEAHFKDEHRRVAKTASNFYLRVPITEIVNIGNKHGVKVRMGVNEDLIKLARKIHHIDENKDEPKT